MAFTVEDLEKLQRQFPDYRMELVDGDIALMTPSGYESEEVVKRVTGKLFSWVDSRGVGRVTGSSAGFILPNSNTRAPKEQRWVEIYRSNAEMVRLEDGDRLTVPDLLPGWEVPLSELWSPVFEN